MSAHSCCQVHTRSGERIRRLASRWGTGGEIAGWIVSTATLALIPKCPACVAAYIALATGVGISFSTAAHLRMLLVVGCIAFVTSLAARRLFRLIKRQYNP